MIFLSPGVYTKETDLSNLVPRLATASAAIVGYSAKGSVDGVILVTNDQQFIKEYGEPDPSSGHYFHYAALAYLAQGNTLYCLRVVNGALYGGVDIVHEDSSQVNAAWVVGKSTAAFDADSGLDDDVLFQVFGANPGVWNDRIAVRVQNILGSEAEEVTDQYTFDIIVYYQDDDGNWAQVESFHVSRKNKVDGFGKNLYIEDKINDISAYIRVYDNTDLADTVLPDAQATNLVLDGGSVGSDPSASDFVTGWNSFGNPDEIDVRILINGGETAAAVQTKIKTVAEARADCLAILDIPWSAVQTVTDMVTFRTTTQNFNSSYCALYGPWVQIWDQYNDKLIYVPPSGHIAAQMAYNDYVGNPWNSPAGLNRGVLNVLGVNLVFTQGERDTLYPQQINPIQQFHGEGIVIWGQKTLQRKASALSSVNVRRLLIVVEKAMAIALRPFLQEPNDELTRFRVKALLDEYLDRLSAQGAFQREGGDGGFQVVCDETNNTPSVIDDNQLNVTVFMKPIRAAEYIQLESVITTTAASFEELSARGVRW